jgi:small subunit ribosomal protein S3
MGQKSHPLSLRLGIIRKSDSTWFATTHYADYLVQDLEIRQYITKRLKAAGVSTIRIFRKQGLISIEVVASRPGLIIGKGGGDIAVLRKDLRKKLDSNVVVSIKEDKNVDVNAHLLADNLAIQLEKRFHFRRAMKMLVQRAMKSGAQGIRVECSGRLAGAEIARREWYREGRVPLHTFRADIHYAVASAYTLYGIIGIKVWVFLGEVVAKQSDIAPTITTVKA